LDACWIGETMGMNTEEWPKETKIKILLSAIVIIGAILFFGIVG